MRLYDPVRTSLCVLHADEGRLEELLALPSGGDASYPGMVVEGNELRVSYYSSHEATLTVAGDALVDAVARTAPAWSTRRAFGT